MSITSSESEYSINLAALADTIARLSDFRADLTEQIDHSHHLVMALGSDWSGIAREAQMTFFRQLNAGMKKVDEGIAEFREVMSDSHTHYTTALDTNISMWTS
ncbi:MAG: WXG100 family type VII secretion target [Mycobacteriaceae bacterium]